MHHQYVHILFEYLSLCFCTAMHCEHIGDTAVKLVAHIEQLQKVTRLKQYLARHTPGHTTVTAPTGRFCLQLFHSM